jgi:hypothetical protein
MPQIFRYGGIKKNALWIFQLNVKQKYKIFYINKFIEWQIKVHSFIFHHSSLHIHRSRSIQFISLKPCHMVHEVHNMNNTKINSLIVRGSNKILKIWQRHANIYACICISIHNSIHNSYMFKR